MARAGAREGPSVMAPLRVLPGVELMSVLSGPEKRKGHHPVRMMALRMFLVGRVHHPLAAGVMITPTLRTTTTR
jgi:hypothetical protein|tara:strand:- start:826 stop:1047 length:222 start_codon:yes stop_codon:yes gene_type:complete